MIVLHRLGHEAEPFYLNPDLILLVEALPDTVVSLTTGSKIVVDEPPEEVAARVRAYRTAILADAMATRPRRGRGGAAAHLHAVEGSPARADHLDR